ncbi:DMT family transporter [Lacihabitans soyangensis]|uniref:EamA family transporter n=1 Tax=Lacihabitans soyangensis TaxID=869394 RepID=A0AAE3KTR9_9BACT|nr:EamA family transporter [Lacihabitans soyangensis]MCP9764767.1 EamA family transporter [Lacihabitans soyangensis]
MRDYLKLHILVLLLSFTGILGKLIEASTLAVVFYRTLVAAVALFLILYFRKVNLKIGLRDLGLIFFVGFLLGLHWLCFFGSAKISTVAISLVTFSTTSFFTSLLEPVLGNKKLDFKEIMLGLLAVVGVAIMFSFEAQYLAGILIGLLGALLCAAFTIFNSKLTYRFDSQLISFYELTAAFVVCWVFYLIFFEKQDLVMSQTDWIWLLVLALVCTVIPHAQMIKIMQKISVFTVNLSLNLEPVYGVVLAYFIFGDRERMSTQFYLGGVLVLLSVFLHPILLKRKPQSTI